MPSVDHDESRDAPGVVIGAVAAGVAPLPFLAVYAVLFISRGTVHPVTPPDIGDSKTTELIAGLVALALFVIGALAALWLLDGRRRWPFVVCQLALLATSIDFIIDSSMGSRAVPVVLAVTSLIALVLAAHPTTWRHMGQEPPSRHRAKADPAPQERIP
jgi:peptidoglycan/LPS O-acetylase OafA/YrhL